MPSGTANGDVRRPPPIMIRNTRRDDVRDLDALQQASYPSLSQLIRWREEHWLAHMGRFPDGQWVAEVDGRVVGACANLRVSFKRATGQHTWKEITSNGTIADHEPDGDTLYGFEIMVHPDYRRLGVGKKLYAARYDYIRDHSLRAFAAMGRIPGYVSKGKPAGLSPPEYVEKVVAGDITDRTLTAQMKSGCKVLGVVTDYIKDPKSADAAAILIWENPSWRGESAEDVIIEGTAEYLPPGLIAQQRGA